MLEIKKLIFRSGFCVDNARFLRFYLSALKNPVLRPLLIALRIKFSPDILENIRLSALPLDKKSSLFSEVMTLFRSGPSYKTTAAGRSPLTDRAILSKSKAGDIICETGVSDGISAFGLLANAGNKKVILTDIQISFLYKDFGPARIFYNKEDFCLSFKFLFFYICTGVKTGAAPATAGQISLLNPLISEKLGAAGIQQFDVFSGTLNFKADIIKCANVLNSVYFSPQEAKLAMENLSKNLKDSGWIFISQNHEKYRDGEAYLALQKQGGVLILREELNSHELLPYMSSTLFSDLVNKG
ncbi:MAG: hypothetical protein WCK75_00265 [Elusimicrobiota bacterium]